MPRDSYVCRNPRCRERLRWQSAGGFCPSCRRAFGRGALLAGAIGFVIHLALRFL